MYFELWQRIQSFTFISINFTNQYALGSACMPQYTTTVLDPNPSSLTLAHTVGLTVLMRQVTTVLDPNPRPITHANASGLTVLMSMGITVLMRPVWVLLF